MNNYFYYLTPTPSPTRERELRGQCQGRAVTLKVLLIVWTPPPVCVCGVLIGAPFLPLPPSPVNQEAQWTITLQRQFRRVIVFTALFYADTIFHRLMVGGTQYANIGSFVRQIFVIFLALREDFRRRSSRDPSPTLLLEYNSLTNGFSVRQPRQLYFLFFARALYMTIAMVINAENFSGV